MPFSRLGLGLLLVAFSSSITHAQDPRVAKMREYLAATARLGQLSGSVLVAERGTILIDTAFGFANIELGVRNTPDTRFRVASVTKQFTGMAVAMLAEAGKLRISDPISRYFDSLPPEWSGITIHHLLRHTSGISDYEGWFDGYTTQAYSDYMSQEHAAARIVRDARKRPLDFAPGSKFYYSNSAYIMLGYIIEKASGMSYEDFLRTRIHEPLGMTLSSQDHSRNILPNRANGYRLRPGSFPVAWYNGMGSDDYQNAYYQLMEPPQGDAGLVTTSRDLFKWDQALNTERLVRKPMLDSIFTPGLEGYGYGWFIASDGPDGLTHEHSGGLPGFACYIMRIPGQQRTIILLGNIERLGRTVRDLAAIMRGSPVAVPQARHLIPADSAINASHTGIYRTASGDSVEIFMNGTMLGAWWREHFRTPLFPEGRDVYFVAQLNARARFTERNGRKELVIDDAAGAVVVQGIRR